MKSILHHVTDDACLEARIQVALDLGRTLGAHVTFMQTLPFINMIPTDVYGMAFANVMPEIREMGTQLREETEKHLLEEDVAWDWMTLEGPADAQILAMVNAYDLLIMGACDPFAPSQLRSDLAADMAVTSHAPVMIVPQDRKGLDCSAPMIAAWDGSAQASRALRAAVPLLKHARTVHLISVEENRTDQAHDLPATTGAEYLSRHGIKSEIVQVRKNHLSISDCIRTAAREREASVIIMGAYGHSRLRENLLGGVTREMMTDPPLPLFMHH